MHTFDLTKPVHASTDTGFLKSILHSLIGARCLKVDLNFGNELMLHIGPPLPYPEKNKLHEEQKGSWILGTRASDWQIRLLDQGRIIEDGNWPPDADTVESGTIDGPALEEQVLALAGKTIDDVRTFNGKTSTPQGIGIGLMFDFSNNSSLLVFPSDETLAEGEQIADWELFTPLHTYLTVGPGKVWSYLPSNIPCAP